MGFSQELREKADPIYRRIFEHPFVRGIGDGTLEIEKFKYYVEQDYLFLIEYSRALALAVARGHDLATMGWFAGLLNETLNTEMELHRSYAAQFGISREALEATRPSPTTVGYTRHLLAAAYSEGFGGVAAALAPCQWGYCEIGQMLARRGRPEAQPLYCQWIDMYASQEFAQLADRLREVVDTTAQGLGAKEQARMEEVFLTSARYEYLFWDAAYRREAWPL